RLVAGWKERGLRTIADDAATVVVERIPRPEAGVVTLIPADRRRRGERGHHPAERLARALAERWRLPCRPLVVRTRQTERQRGLALADRRRSVRRPAGPRRGRARGRRVHERRHDFRGRCRAAGRGRRERRRRDVCPRDSNRRTKVGKEPRRRPEEARWSSTSRARTSR